MLMISFEPVVSSNDHENHLDDLPGSWLAIRMRNISISYRSTYCNQRLKHSLSSLFASTFASRAVSSTDNKLQQSDNLDFKTLPFPHNSTRPNPPAAHSSQGTGYKCSCLKRISQPLHSSIPPRLLLPGIFSSSPPPCWPAGWLRVFLLQ